MKILSLDGGGTRGYVTSKILSNLEVESGKRCYEIFDLCAGVSTGAIVAAMLSKGSPAADVMKLYREDAKNIFKDKKNLLISIFKPTYEKANLRSVLRKHMDVKFGDMKMKTMIYAIRTDNPNGQVKFWKSWREEYKNISTVDIVQSSCSAPTYFAPHSFDGATYVDGGPFCNNPTMCCIAEALRMGHNLNKLSVVNIALDEWKGFDKSYKMDSIKDWITKISDLCVGSSQEAIEYQATQLLGNKNYIIQSPRWTDLDSLNFDYMDKIANECWLKHRDYLLEYARI